MATTNELLINITYDDAKAIANFKKVADKITTQASQQEKKINDIKTTAQAKREVDEQKHLDRIRRQNEIHQQRLEQKLEQSNAKILNNQNSWSKRMTDSLGGIANSIKTMALVWVSAQVSAAFSGAVKHADEIGDLASAYNLTTSAVQKLSYQFKSAGTDVEGMSGFLAKMSLKLSEANTKTKEGEKAQKDLAKLGIGANDDIAIAMNKVVIAVANGTANVNILRDVFGKLGVTALPMLKDMATQAELTARYGNVRIISESNMEILGKFQKDLDMLGITLKSAFSEAIAGFLGKDAKTFLPDLIKSINETNFEKIGKATKTVSTYGFEVSTVLLKIGVLASANNYAILKSFDDLIGGESELIGVLRAVEDAFVKNNVVFGEAVRMTESAGDQLEAFKNLETVIYNTYRIIRNESGLTAEGLANDAGKITATFEALSKGTLPLKESLKFLWSADYSKIAIAVTKAQEALKGTAAVGGVIEEVGAWAKAGQATLRVFGAIYTFITRILGTVGLVVNSVIKWGAEIRYIGTLFRGLQSVMTFVARYFLVISAVLSAIDFFSVYKRATTVIGVWKNFIYSVMYTLIQIADGFTFTLLGRLESTKKAIALLKKWIDDNSFKPNTTKEEEGNNKSSNTYLPFSNLKLTPGLRKAIETNNKKELEKYYKEYSKYIKDQEGKIILGKLSEEDPVYLDNKKILEAINKVMLDSKDLTPLEAWMESIKKGADETGLLAVKINHIQKLFSSAKSEELKNYYFNILEGLVKERDALEDLTPILTRHQEVLNSFANNTLDEFNKMKEASESYVENLDYLWEQFYTARGKDARNFWRDQIDKLMAPVNDLPKNTNFEDAIRLGEEYAQSVVELTSFEKQRLDVEKAIKSTIAGTVVEYTNLEYNYKRSIELIDAEIAKNKDNIEVQNKLIALKKKTTEDYKNRDGSWRINTGTSFNDIFGDTWEQQLNTINTIVDSAKNFSSALVELGNQTMQNAVETISKQIEAENALWNTRSENLKAAGLENTAYYRMMEKEHNKNLKNMQDAENKAKAEAWDKEQEYKKASMVSDLAMGIFKIWAESAGNIFKAIGLTALLSGTFGVQMATINSLKNPFRKFFGGWVGGSGASDNQAHLLAPGEFVVNSQAAKNNARALNDMNNGRNINEPAINIHINGNVIGNRDYVRNHLAPEIKKAIKEGYSFA